jgi:putative serine/threonine protein kinase
MAKVKSVIVPVEDLDKDPYRAVVGYPNPDSETVGSRINQLIDLNVAGLEFDGPLKIGSLSIIGKGVVGMVFKGISNGDRVAVKVRRVDSRRASMSHEAEMLRAANDAGIGPECLGFTKDVLVMRFVDGKRLPEWISSLQVKGRRRRVRSTFKDLFEQCVRLDAYGLDHGELSRAHKNVLISDNDHPSIVDFESASLMRRVNNFTSIGQYLFLSGRFGRKIQRVLGEVDREELVRYLKLYKSGKTNDAFDAILKLTRLDR